jgi:hypothetical protein
LVGHVACMVEMRNAYNVFVGKLYGRIISEWILGKEGGKVWTVGWIHVTQGRYQWQAVVNTVMNLRVA